MRPRHTLPVALVGAISAAPLAAQFRPEVALGITVPTGGLGTHRGAGPLVEVGVLVGGLERRTHLRFTLAWAAMPGEDATERSSSVAADLQIATIAADLLIGPRGGRVAPYGVVGLASHQLQATGITNPYGRSLGAQAGLGLRVRTGGRRPLEVRGEVAPHVILSDFATGQEYGVGSYWPVTVRLTF